MEGGAEEASRRGRSCGGARPSGAGEGKGGRREREAPIGGPRVSETHKKKKRKKEKRATAGEVKWAGGLLGRKVRR
jgi:hypothetical protein